MIFIHRHFDINPDLAIQPIIEVQLQYFPSLCSFGPQILKMTDRYSHILKWLKLISKEGELEPIAAVIVIVVHVLHPNGLLFGHSLRGARRYQLRCLLRCPQALHPKGQRVYLSAGSDGLDVQDAQRKTEFLFLRGLAHLLSHAL